MYCSRRIRIFQFRFDEIPNSTKYDFLKNKIKKIIVHLETFLVVIAALYLQIARIFFYEIYKI